MLSPTVEFSDDLRRAARSVIFSPPSNSDDLHDNLVSLFHGEPSALSYFDTFLGLPASLSLSRQPSLEKMLEFIFSLFFNGSPESVQFQALCIINSLFSFPDLDLFPYFTPSFCQFLVDLLPYPNKALSHHALLNIYNLLWNRIPFQTFAEFGLFDKLWSSIPATGSDLWVPNLEAVGVLLSALLLQEISPHEKEIILQFAIRLIESLSDAPVVYGLSILKSLQPIAMPVELPSLLLSLVSMSGKVLNQLFAFLADKEFKEGDELTEWLMDEKFFIRLMERIREKGDFEIAQYVFRFLAYEQLVPDLNDQILSLALELAHDGPLRAKMDILQYLHGLLLEPEVEFAVLFVERGLVEVVAEVMAAGTPGLDFGDGLTLIGRLQQKTVLAGMNFREVPGFAALLETLAEQIGEYNGLYDQAIEQIIGDN
jgi:hypothetical protein